MEAFRPYIMWTINRRTPIKVVLGGYPRCPDDHDLSKCLHLYDLAGHVEQS